MGLTNVKLLKIASLPVLYLTIGFANFLTFPVLAISQDNNYVADASQAQQNSLTFTRQQNPPDRGTPPTKEGTGSRGNCLYKHDRPPLTRLVGGAQTKLTLQNYPTLWIYIPYTKQESPSGEFSLQDENSEIHKSSFELPNTPGIVSMNLPSTVQPLEIGKTYRWYVNIDCPSEPGANPASSISLTGIVQKVAPTSSIENELKTATPIERINIYVKNGLFIDAVTELAKQRLNSPQNPTFKQIWVELLSQPNMGLRNIATEPIIGNSHSTANYQLK